MAGSTTLNQPLGKYPASLTAKFLTNRFDSRFHRSRLLQIRRFRKRTFPRPGTGRKADSSCKSGRRTGPGTTLLQWKFEDAGHSGKPSPETCGNPERKAINYPRRAVEACSARKLAAGICNLQLREVIRRGRGGREATGDPLGFEHAHGDLKPAHACNDNSRTLHFDLKNGFSSSVPLHRFVSPMLPNLAMERATKWEAGCPTNSKEVLGIFSQLKLLEHQHVSTASIISSLQEELEGARARIYELEAEQHSAKKKMDSFMRKIAEEKSLWRSKEHEKVWGIINIMKNDLSREKKNKQWCEVVNSKLRNELAEAKLSVKQLLQDYEKERKARELMEEVCEELAKEIEDDKDEAAALKRDSMKIKEEMEEERKMLQIAEVWREERVQMKLLDAKLALEDKYSKLGKLQAELVSFLRTWTGSSIDKAEIRRAELLKEALDMVNIEEIKEFTYQPPPASEDIFAVFEELQRKEVTNEREIEACYVYSPASHDSNIHSISPATDAFLEKPTKYCNRDTEEDSDWETLSPGEEQELRNSGGSESSVNEMRKESNAVVSRKDGGRNTDNGKVNCENSKVYSLAARQQGKKVTSLTRLWGLSCPNNDEIHRKVSSDLLNGKVSDGRILNVALSPVCRLAEAAFSPIDQWNSPDSVNHHKARGIKGCIEWPRGSQNKSLKKKLLEARMESHNTLLCHVLRKSSTILDRIQ